jgi:hypothetical protein
MNASKSAPGSPEHRLDDAIAYHYDEMTPEARTEFEEHLRICAGCREALATADVVFPNLPAVLQRIKPRRTTDELLAIMDDAQRRLDEGKRVVPELEVGPPPVSRWLRPHWHWRFNALALTAAAVAILLLATLLLLLRHPNPGQEIYAPHKQRQRSP